MKNQLMKNQISSSRQLLERVLSSDCTLKTTTNCDYLNLKFCLAGKANLMHTKL